MTDDGPDRVRVRGAAGRPCTPTYKVSATFVDGMRATGMLTIIGIDAAAKARRTAAAVLARTRRLFGERGLPDYRDTLVEVLGAESVYGPHARASHAREVVMRLSVEHDDRRALEIFAREIAPAGTSWSPGTTGAGGRPKPTPIVRLTSFLLPKNDVEAVLEFEGARETIEPLMPEHPWTPAPVPAAVAAPSHAASVSAQTIDVPLVALAWARSGDKGDSANIGVIARASAYVPILRDALTAERVAAYFAHLVRGRVRRFDVPGIDAFNFTLDEALGGGGMASMRIDPLAKGMAQMLLDIPIAVPISLAPLLANASALAPNGAL
jgi:hypothetical protein